MPERTDNRTGRLRLFDVDDFAAAVNRLGCSFALCDIEGKLVFVSHGKESASSEEELTETGSSSISVFSDAESAREPQKISERYFAVPLCTASGELIASALVELDHDSGELLTCAVSQMLKTLAGNFRLTSQTEDQIEMVSAELSQVYEELVLLHKLSANMKVTETDCNYLQMACDSLTDIVPVEGIVILLEKMTDGHKELVLAAGAGVIDIDPHNAAIMHCRLEEQIDRGKEALLDSDIDSPFIYEWPESIKNIIVAPLFGKDKKKSAADAPRSHKIIGLMAAVNRIERADFDSVDAKLFNSVANGCAVFIENGRLFNDLKELFIGSLKALTNSIDAKDQYTRGHSERVAFISKWIAEQLTVAEPLEEEEIHKIYLAGLLHDVGKMGVDEAVLRKEGKLTDEEYDCIKTHPSIGAGILGDIKQMRDIVPGVLCHHERVDGRGYPNHLSDEAFPLIGKIVGLADSFDAMTSKRTYRNAMSVEQALAEIERGLGTQFDEKIGRIFLDSDVYHLWDMIQDGLKDVYDGTEQPEYGTIAVGTLIG